MPKTFGERIKKLREMRGDSGEFIARRLEKFGVTIATQTYYNWEKNEGGPDPKQLVALAHIFNVEVGDLAN